MKKTDKNNEVKLQVLDSGSLESVTGGFSSFQPRISVGKGNDSVFRYLVQKDDDDGGNTDCKCYDKCALVCSPVDLNPMSKVSNPVL